MMVCTVLIHAMLEFPQRYAYFLLTCGFLLGIVQAQTTVLKGIILNKHLFRLSWVVSLLLIITILRDYNVYVLNSNLLLIISVQTLNLWEVVKFCFNTV